MNVYLRTYTKSTNAARRSQLLQNEIVFVNHNEKDKKTNFAIKFLRTEEDITR